MAATRTRGLRANPALTTVLALALATWMAPPSSAAMPDQLAQQQVLTVDLSAGALSTALQQLAAQADIQIGFDSALLKDKTTEGLKGSYTVDQALDRLLAGTGLRSEFAGSRTVTVVDASAGQSGGTIVLPTIEVTGGSGGVIQAEGYTGISSATGAKTDTPFLETPQSISSVTEAQLEDRNPQNLLDAISYTPGARVFAYGTDPRYDSFFVRGFNLTNTGVFRDNLRQPTGGYGYFQTEPYGVEGISILRGPSSALYGATGAGGLYNVITKRPRADALREVQLQVGTDDRYQGQFDLTGPANEDGTLLYRLTGLGRQADTEFDAVSDDKAFFAPAVTWKPRDGTKLTLLAELSHTETGGNPAYYNDSYGHVSEFESGDPAFSALDHTQARIGWELDHEINDTFTVRQNARYSTQDITSKYVYTYNGTAHASDPTLVDRGSGYEEQTLDAFVIDNQLETRLATGPLDHTFLTGLDISWADFENRTGYGAVAPLDTVNLNYGAFIATPDLTSRTDQTQIQAGIYLQDQIRFAEAWTLTVGGRHDWVKTETDNTDLTSDTTSSSEQTEREWSGRIGLTYQTGFGLAPYASLSTAFSPNIGTNTTTGAPFKPTVSTQEEIGVKYLSPDSTFMATAALFNVDQEDGLFYEVINGVNTQVQRGRLNSQGVELEATASLDGGLSLTASYTFTEMKIEEGTAATEGNYVSSVPRHMASAWANYALPTDTVFDGFTVGLGGRYVGSSYGDDSNTLTNGERVYVDAALGYDLGALDTRLEGVNLQVNATNLLDRRDTTCTSGYCYRDPGRTVIASFRYRW